MLRFKKKWFNKIRYITLGVISWAFCFLAVAHAQNPGNAVATELQNILRQNSLDGQAKLKKLYSLKSRMDSLGENKDSSYATVLTQIAAFKLKINRDFTNAIILTNEALQINLSGRNGSSKTDAVQASLHLAYDYEDLGILGKALAYYDTTMQLCKRFQDTSRKFLYAKVQRAYLFFRMGDYQKSIEENFDGEKYALQSKDLYYYFSLLNQKAQSHFYLHQINEAIADIETVLKNPSVSLYPFQLANALKVKAMIAESNKDTTQAGLLFKRSTGIRITMGMEEYDQIADDYTDWGNFYLNSLHDHQNAIKCYLNAIKYAGKKNDSLMLSKSFINLSYASLDKNDFQQAVHFTNKAMQYLKLTVGNDILVNPLSKQLNLIGNKDPVVALMSNKTLLLFKLYIKTNDVKYLQSCIKTALLTDEIITQMRYLHSGDQSKLYWRNKTRDFFSTAIEACYYASDFKNAFYFMEKSRAVLLNDKLNELGASFQLSEADAKTEQDFKIGIAIEQQKLSGTAINSNAYNEQRLKLIRVKDDFQHFVQSLENKYPAYYNYKYSDKIPGLEDIQKYLATTNASFVHYFTSDTLAYILSITANKAKIIKLSKNDFNYKQINDFLLLCADRNRLNTKNNYRAFTILSNNLYRTLFQPIHLAKGRVIICTDNFLLPFEALCSDSTGNNFLINDYTFSYAYSATYLLKITRPSIPRGNFIGFAPVSFRANLSVSTLSSSEPALKESASNYSSSLLFTNKSATKNNFIQNIGGYAVANIFSHASSDNTGSEPKLYMQDSLIYLSDLQLLNNPSTRLVILSACQTNVGKYAAGEGIYSLARGFASAGIPSVSATLWEADENMIYEVSIKFNKYLSQGMCKDSALNRAKLDFIKTNRNTGKSLPYYWANIILIGNTAPLDLATESHKWLWAAGALAIALLLIIFIIILRKRKGLNRLN